MEKEQIVEALCRAADEVFSTMLNVTLVAGEPRIGRTPPEHQDGVVSFVGLAGPLVGLGSISCGGNDACVIASRMLMAELPNIDAEVLDAVGEITNMVIGAFKQQIEEVVGPMAISIPTVIYGHNFTAKHLGDEEWVLVPFKSEEASFEVQVCFSKRVPQPHSPSRLSIPVTQ